MDLHLGVLKEPRGFIRVVQFVFSIFAFSTTAGFSGSTSFMINCRDPPSLAQTVDVDFAYPFKSIQFTKLETGCAVDDLKDLKYSYSFASSAEFFVATGVLSFLFTIGISAIYILMNRMYTTNQLVPIVDLGATGVLALFWLAGSSAWAQGVSDTKYYTSPAAFLKRLAICKDNGANGLASCEPVSLGNYASLNISLIFGFANFALWLASMWFVYKETVFHMQRQESMAPPQQAPMPPQSQSPQSGVQSPEGYKY